MKILTLKEVNAITERAVADAVPDEVIGMINDTLVEAHYLYTTHGGPEHIGLPIPESCTDPDALMRMLSRAGWTCRKGIDDYPRGLIVKVTQ